MKHESFWMWCAATSASLAMVAGAATAAFAQGRPVTVTGTRADAEYFSVLVSYRDLNLAVAADERRLKRRVNIATHEVCRPAGAI